MTILFKCSTDRAPGCVNLIRKLRLAWDEGGGWGLLTIVQQVHQSSGRADCDARPVLFQEFDLFGDLEVFCELWTTHCQSSEHSMP